MFEDIYSKNSIIRDLETLSSILTSYSVCQEYSAVYKASQECQYDFGENEWGYSCEGIQFRIDEKISGTIPSDIEEIFLSLSVRISGQINDLNHLKDPLQTYQLDLDITGNRIEKDSIIAHYSAWHLDKHIPEIGDSATKRIHPCYHLQFGGKNMEAIDYGEAIILSSPRIPYPPMDVVLGVHFILSDFFHYNQMIPIIEDSEYRQIVRNSQRRLWKPYYQASSTHWNSEDECQWNPIDILPMLRM